MHYLFVINCIFINIEIRITSWSRGRELPRSSNVFVHKACNQDHQSLFFKMFLISLRSYKAPKTARRRLKVYFSKSQVKLCVGSVAALCRACLICWRRRRTKKKEKKSLLALPKFHFKRISRLWVTAEQRKSRPTLSNFKTFERRIQTQRWGLFSDHREQSTHNNAILSRPHSPFPSENPT